jgi:dienelactone hydrolase
MVIKAAEHSLATLNHHYMANTKSRRRKAVIAELLSFASITRSFSFAFGFTLKRNNRRNDNFLESLPDSRKPTIMSAAIPQDSVSSFSWDPLAPGRFANSPVSSDGCRFAKDDTYLKVVLKSWETNYSINDPPIETSSYVYRDFEETRLYGHVVRTATNDMTMRKRPGVLLFHTAAGPQDIFLFYRAYLLAKNINCVVMICDILSDSDGWAWGPDRTQYNHVRSELAKDDNRLLISRVEAAIRAILEVDKKDGTTVLNIENDRLAIMGWCLGGQPILEVPRVQMSTEMDFSVRALVTFHGVFHRETPLKLLPKSNSKGCGKVLICNGNDDPFVSKDDLQSAKAYFESAGYKVDIAQMKGAKHGFTNPAQAFNENNSFGYNDAAAEASWEMTLNLLRETFSR